MEAWAKMRLFILTLVLAAMFVPSAESADLPKYTVLRATDKIVLDGILDEADWAAAPSVGPFKFPWYVEGEQEQTDARMLWNDTFLYVAFKCNDKHIWAEFYDTNSTTYKDDTVEIFWDPSPLVKIPERKYNMFEINCIGNLLSVYVGSGENISQRISRIMVPHITQSIKGTVNNDEDIDEGWIIELAIRFEDYTEIYTGETPKNGDMWRIGLNRLGGKTNQQHSQWSPSQTEKPSFHSPKDFGEVYFSTKPVR